MRYWITSGRGDFGIVPSETTSNARFYCVVHDYDMKKTKQKEVGVKEVFVRDIPSKPKLLATVKSNNYMLNALLTLRAKEIGGDLGIALDSNGYIQESSIANFAMVTQDKVLKTPRFDGILAGTTVKRAYDLKDSLLENKIINGFEFCDLTEKDALEAAEMIMFGVDIVTHSRNGRQKNRKWNTWYDLPAIDNFGGGYVVRNRNGSNSIRLNGCK